MARNQDYNITEFFQYIYGLTKESDRRYGDTTLEVCNLMVNKLSTVKNALKLLEIAKQNDCVELQDIQNIPEITVAVNELLTYWKELHQVKETTSPEKFDYSHYKCETSQTGQRGRPPYKIEIDIITNLQILSFSWKEIAEIIGIHRTTLWRFLSRNYPEILDSKYSKIDDNELDLHINKLKKEHPLAGERMIIGLLRSQSIFVQRFKVRNSIHRVDPVNTAIRWIRKNPRWAYSVRGPNALWHNDGLHKLIHWKIVVHACVDGYSRLITYLKCAPNNLASTVLSAFIEATKKYGIPERMRGDHGGENVQVAEYLRRVRNSDSAYIQGPSVHNQRIERLHYDTTHCVLSHYVSLFLFMETEGILNRCSDVDLFCLHHIYLSRIQSSLDRFSEGWNHHQMSTEGNKSPFQLFATGMMNRNFKEHPGVISFHENDDMYGAEIISSSSEYLDNNHVEVEEIDIPMKIREAVSVIDITTDDGNFGINHFIKLKQEIEKKS